MRVIYGLAFALLLSGALPSAGQAATVVHQIAFTTAPSENSCLLTTATGNGDDCSYNASNPSGAGTSQWIGPTFSAGYYARSSAPEVYSDPAVPTPVTAPAAVLPIGGELGIPGGVTLRIDDNGTPLDHSDDIISLNIDFQPFDRNVDLGNGSRAIETFGYLQYQLVPRTPDSITPNAAGGFDYVFGSKGVPAPLSGTTSQASSQVGVFSDSFPSEVGSQSSSDAGDVAYWSAAGSAGIASFEGNVGGAMDSNLTAGGGIKCKAAAGGGSAATCPNSPMLRGQSAAQATPTNVLMRFSTDATGAVTSGVIILVWEFRLSTDSSTTSNDSWQATTITLGSDAVLTLANASVDLADVPQTAGGYQISGLMPDSFFSTNFASSIQVLTPPAHGTLSISDRLFSYTPTGGTAPDSFLYQVTDAFGQTASATITVNGLIAITDNASTTSGVPVIIHVLDNDVTLTSSAITVTIVIPPSAGTAVVNSDNTITYTSDPNFAGCSVQNSSGPCSFVSPPPDQFRYQVADVNGVKSVANVSVNVYPNSERKSGSSAMDPLVLLTLSLFPALRRRRGLPG